MRIPIFKKTIIERNTSYIAEPLEKKITKILSGVSNEDLGMEKPLIYAERKEGVIANTNIRTDRFELAQAAMDKVTKKEISKRLPVTEKTKEGDKAETASTSD